jgi:hypothetical protein
MFSLPSTAGLFGAIMVVESAKKETDFSRSLDSAALLQAAEAARIAVSS